MSPPSTPLPRPPGCGSSCMPSSRTAPTASTSTSLIPTTTTAAFERPTAIKSTGDSPRSRPSTTPTTPSTTTKTSAPVERKWRRSTPGGEKTRLVPLLRDDLQDHRRRQQRRRLLFGGGELGAHGLGPGRLDASHLELVAQVDVDESRRPLPELVAGAGAEDARDRLADGEAALLQQPHHGRRDVRFSARVAPALLDLAHELAHARSRRRDSQAVVLDVLMEDRDTARADHGRNLVEQQRRRADEAGDPAAPARVHAPGRQRVGHEVELVVLEVRVAVAREHGAARLDEARGALDGDDPSRRAHDLGEVRRGKARSRADVDDLRARADAGAAPAVEHGRPPDAVLQAETLELLVVRSEEVGALGHQSHFALRRRWNR